MTPAEKKKFSDARWYRENREEILARRRPRYKAQNSKRLQKEENREKHRQCSLRWQKENAARVNERIADREARKIKATPSWSDKNQIRDIYHAADAVSRITGIKRHVDHIVPLRSKLVCGLHCEDNLQIIPAADNFMKSNRHWPDMPEA